ncbi:MAG: protein sphX, partial [Dehalococcoidia bacterium]|nr:protein sphX [Dehalococcoidia bacterium]
DILKMVAVDSGNGCIKPTDETINNGTYTPLSRPLFNYVSKKAWEEPDVKDFISYFVSYDRAELLRDLGFVPFPERVHDLVLDRFQRGLSGTIFGGENRQHGTVEEILAANQ